MPKYLCMQRKLPNADGPKGQKPSPAQMQEMYAQFGAWQAKFKENLVDMGGKLGQGRLVTTQTAADVSAESLDEAIEVARGCPGLVGPGSGVEVIEIHTP